MYTCFFLGQTVFSDVLEYFQDDLGGGFRYFLCSPLFGEDEPILTCAYFQMGGSTTNQ